MDIKSCEESRQSGIKIYTRKPWNLIKSGYFVVTWVVLGFHLELVGPTLLILSRNVNVDYSGMSSALASRSAGYLLANVIGALLQNIVKKYSEALLFCAFILPAFGTAQGLTDLGGTNILLTMWGENAAAPLNTAHLGYGIGAVFVNLLVRPFLSQNKTSINNKNETSFNENSNIFIPYSITSILCLLTAFGHLFFYIKQRQSQKDKSNTEEVDDKNEFENDRNLNRLTNKTRFSSYSPRTCGRGNFQYGLVLSMTFIIYIFFIGGNDQTFSKFFFAYLKFKEFNITTEAASWATILYWLSYSIGRLIGAIASVYISVNICLNIIWLGGFFLALFWFIFVWFIGLTSTSLFLLGSLTGLVFSPMFPLSFALFNQRLNVIPILIALLLSGSAIGAITLQKLAGIVMDKNPKHFPTLLIICLLMSIIAYILSNIIYFVHRRNNKLNTRPSLTHGAPLSTEIFNEEEQQMNNYLRDQEDL